VIRSAVRGTGELLITAGLVVLLFVTYQLFWTNYEAHKATASVTNDLRDSWDRPDPTGAGSSQTRGPKKVDFGKGFAFLHIPRLGKNWTIPVVEGVDLPSLARGVGHYPKTADPGQVGNFAVAGHRATNGEPFAYLDRVRKGDLVIAETRTEWFTYVVDRTKIVSPTSVWVLDPVPGHPDTTPVEPLMTLTTCNPRWASYQRLIVFGHLQESRAKADGPPAALLRPARDA
jgi:sortase A